MTKTNELANSFIQKSANFTQVRSSINAFRSLFSVQELSKQESLAIEQMLIEAIDIVTFPVDALDEAIEKVKRLTQELRAIKRHGAILIGERIAQVREVFRTYNNRSFRTWMKFTFGSFKTGYNYLAFYDLYSSIPEDLKQRLREMPARTVYWLASKRIPVEQKIELLQKGPIKTSRQILKRLQEDRQNSSFGKLMNQKIIRDIEQRISLILSEQLDDEQKNRISNVIDSLKDLISKHISA